MGTDWTTLVKNQCQDGRCRQVLEVAGVVLGVNKGKISLTIRGKNHVDHLSVVPDCSLNCEVKTNGEGFKPNSCTGCELCVDLLEGTLLNVDAGICKD